MQLGGSMWRSQLSWLFLIDALGLQDFDALEMWRCTCKFSALWTQIHPYDGVVNFRSGARGMILNNKHLLPPRSDFASYLFLCLSHTHSHNPSVNHVVPLATLFTSCLSLPCCTQWDKASRGGGKGGWELKCASHERSRVWTLRWNLCRLLSSLKEKICVCVYVCVVQELQLISSLHIRAHMHTHTHKCPRRAYKFILACTVMQHTHTHIYTHTHTLNPHGFDDAKQQEPQGAACLDKTKQMFMCTMSP